MLPSGVVLPRNIGGFPWWGASEDGDNHKDSFKERFHLDLITPNGRKALPFDLAPEDAAVAEKGAASWQKASILVVRPSQPLIPGSTYRVSYQPRRNFVDEVVGIDFSEQHAEYRISQGSFQWTAGPRLRLELGSVSVGELSVSTPRGSCSTTIVAAKQEVRFILPPSFRRWRSALLYAFYIPGALPWWYRRHGQTSKEPKPDGVTWRPSGSVCSNLPHGRSWMGLGRELLYTKCSGGEPHDDLSGGTHSLEATAWLPGTSFVFRASTEVSLRCP